MKLRLGETLFEVVVQAAAGAEDQVVAVDGRPVRLRLEAAGPPRFLVRHGSRCEAIHVVRDEATIHVHWRGTAFRLTEEKEGLRRQARAAESRLEAPMPGKVIAVRVRPGDLVKKGQELLVVEAMKMENALRAPREGRVLSVHAKPGDMVSPGGVLVELE